MTEKELKTRLLLLGFTFESDMDSYRTLGEFSWVAKLNKVILVKLAKTKLDYQIFTSYSDYTLENGHEDAYEAVIEILGMDDNRKGDKDDMHLL